MNYKKTLNILNTNFPMKGNLPKIEPSIIKKWQQECIYEIIRLKSHGKNRFILHDGPPYANGNIHIGHALNKILKDIIIKSKNMSGYDAIYTPGWDCHGMPIEIKLESKYKTKLSIIEMQKKARTYAFRQIKNQKIDFQRLGIIADWCNYYLTMNYFNESMELIALGYIFRKGYLFKDLKPVYWCFNCKSNLSEAELENINRKDFCIYVSFPFIDMISIRKVFNLRNIEMGSIVIWTTTPWTIPSNQALNINPNLYYSLVQLNTISKIGSSIIISSKMSKNCLKKWFCKGFILSNCQGKSLSRIKFSNPLSMIGEKYSRISNINVDKYVSTKIGTGIVHISPAHGIEDFYSFKKYNISKNKIIDIVMEDGKYIYDLPLLGNFDIWSSNEKIVKYLNKSGTLLMSSYCLHNYMHCWRHKTPVIYKITNQWFVNMKFLKNREKLNLKSLALSFVNETKFYSKHGFSILKNMVSKRPNWNISRQRYWGVPVSLIINKKTNKLHYNTLDIINKLSRYSKKYGIESWKFLKKKYLINNDFKLYRKNFDTLDVWFDSGTTHYTVLNTNSKNKVNKNFYNKFKLYAQADLYIEGSDQNRGWFQSSMLTACILFRKSPYKNLITHGFVVDEEGKKMSKSLGNIIKPQKICNAFGAEILRLWVASSDYSKEISISNNIINSIIEIYRRIRNTIRFILINLSDFDKKIHLVNNKYIFEIDRYALTMIYYINNNTIKNYTNYNYYIAVEKIQNFCSEYLSSFYLDILKDRLYTNPPNSLSRRSAQNTLINILIILIKLIAPFLSFTAEESWGLLNIRRTKNHTSSIFISTYNKKKYFKKKKSFFYKWNKIRYLRSLIMYNLEYIRSEFIIGSSLQILLNINLPEKYYLILKNIKKELKFLLIVSKATIFFAKKNTLKIEIIPNENIKCIRCWHYTINTRNDNFLNNICRRCIKNLFGNGEIRKIV